MTLAAAERALVRATKAYHHATAMLARAESESARKRHARRALNASRTMTGLKRDVARLTLATVEQWDREAA